MAAGRPLIFIGDPAGESAELIAQAGCGVAVASGDGDALAAAIVRLADDAAAREAMGQRGREVFERRYTLRNARRQWHETLASLGYSSS
jgi:glycosyltransferase involved in cell wall biosynthesis